MQCKARVQLGTRTYSARNSERQCKNPATEGAYCHAHKRYNDVVALPADLLDTVRAQLSEIDYPPHTPRYTALVYRNVTTIPAVWYGTGRAQ